MLLDFGRFKGIQDQKDTPSIRLRGTEQSDGDFLLDWASHPEITRNTLGRRFPLQASSISSWISDSNHGSFPTRVAYIIESEAESCGLAQLDQIDWVSRNAWLGIWLTPKSRNRGFGRFAVGELLKLATQTLNLRQVRLLVRTDNIRAIGLYGELGFVNEGVLLDCEYRDGALTSLALMRRDLKVVSS